MNLKNTSSSLSKTLTCATQFTGGLADEHNSQICFAWPVTSYVFLVSIQSHLGCRTSNVQYVQVLLSLLKGFSWVVVTQSPSDALASVLTPFVFLCLLRSAYILHVSKLMLFYIMDSLGSY